MGNGMAISPGKFPGKIEEGFLEEVTLELRSEGTDKMTDPLWKPLTQPRAQPPCCRQLLSPLMPGPLPPWALLQSRVIGITEGSRHDRQSGLGPASHALHLCGVRHRVVVKNEDSTSWESFRPVTVPGVLWCVQWSRQPDRPQ